MCNISATSVIEINGYINMLSNNKLYDAPHPFEVSLFSYDDFNFMISFAVDVASSAVTATPFKIIT